MRTFKFCSVFLLSFCLVSVGSSTTTAQPWSEGPIPQKGQQAKSPGKTQAETIEWLGTVIEGNAAKTTKPPDGSDLYKYESFRFEGCSLFWRETHEAFEGQTRVSKTLEDVSIPLSMLSRTSVRVDKVGVSVYVVSFTTLKLESAITSRMKVTYQDGTEDKSISARSGYGVYFQDDRLANQVSMALVSSIRSCQKEKQP